MGSKDINLIIDELSNIILNSPLYNSSGDTNELLRSISKKEIKENNTSEYSLLADLLKELHYILKNIDLELNDVAFRNHKQLLDYLSKFYGTFDLMLSQLKEREKQFESRVENLEVSLKLLSSIVESQDNWVIAMDIESKEILYINSSAKECFYNPETNESWCKCKCKLMDELKKLKYKENDFEYFCAVSYRYILTKNFLVEMDNRKIMVYILSDITGQKVEQEQLSNFAYKDELTGIHNRRFCFEKIEYFNKNEDIFSLVLIDVDGLKYVNDNFGHAEGDSYICQVVEAIRKNIREIDILSRVGGDEFIIILLNCTEDSAINKMESICKEIKKIRRNYPLSISYGVTYVSGRNRIPLQKLINESDKKMYVYKSKNKEQRKTI